MARQPGFFDLDERYAELSESGDPLERLTRVVDFEIFRVDLERALKRSERAKGGRPQMDAVMMFKILIIQALWGVSDEQVEYQMRDRLSWTLCVPLRAHALSRAGRCGPGAGLLDRLAVPRGAGQERGDRALVRPL
jgi:hypothetical protein